MDYLDGMKGGGLYLLSENLSIFTAAEHFECQPILLISVLLFHVYLTCWVFPITFPMVRVPAPCGNLMGKSHAPSLPPYQLHWGYLPTLAHSLERELPLTYSFVTFF